MDCNSEDKTREIAQIYSTNTHKSKKKNRGLQLNIGAKKAKGEWFLFVHADSRLSKGWLKKVNSRPRLGRAVSLQLAVNEKMKEFLI